MRPSHLVPRRRVPRVRRTGRLGGLGAPLVLVLGLLFALAGASPASASAGESLSLLNGARQSAGLAALSSSSDLDGVAQSWAQTMAADGQLRHNPSLSSAVGGWSAIAENVGTGGSVRAVHDALMGSSGHRANILGSYTQVGVGVANGNGAVWVVQVFRTPNGAPPAAAPAPAPVAAPAPAPAPAPAAAPAPAPAPAARPAARPPAPAAAPVARPAPAEASRAAPPAPVEAAPPLPVASGIFASAAMRAVPGRGPGRVFEPYIV